MTTEELKANYSKKFLKEATVPARFGKTVYIRKEHHQRIQAFLRTVTDNDVSLFSFIDNVLTEHFENHQSEIQELYNEQVKPLFEPIKEK